MERGGERTRRRADRRHRSECRCTRAELLLRRGKSPARTFPASQEPVCQMGRKVYVRLRRRVRGTSQNHWLAGGKRISSSNRARDDDREDDVRGKMPPHVFHHALTRRIPRLEHRHEDAVQRELLVDRRDVLNSTKYLRSRLQRERLALKRYDHMLAR